MLDERVLISDLEVFVRVLALVLQQFLVLSLPALLVLTIPVVSFKQLLLALTHEPPIRQFQ